VAFVLLPSVASLSGCRKSGTDSSVLYEALHFSEMQKKRGYCHRPILLRIIDYLVYLFYSKPCHLRYFL